MWVHPNGVYTECQLAMRVMPMIGYIYANTHLCMLGWMCMHTDVQCDNPT